MKMMKSLFLGSAAGLVAIAGAQAADLPVKAKAVEYVKVCSAYGAGFYYIPGTDMCLRVGGYMYVETGINQRSGVVAMYSGVLGSDLNFNRDDNQWQVRVSAEIILDARTQSAIGTVRSYLRYGVQWATSTTGSFTGTELVPGLDAAFIQFAGFTAGFTDSFFNFGNFYHVIGLAAVQWQWLPVWAYTAQFGNGLSGTISIENSSTWRTKLQFNTYQANSGTASTTTGYGAQEWPDIIANLRVDQAWGSAQISGALHQVRINNLLANAPNFNGDAWGWAAGGTIEIKTPMVAPGNSLLLQATYSVGALEYTGLSSGPATNTGGMGFRLNGGPGPVYDLSDGWMLAGNTVQLQPAWSATAQYRHYWQPNLRTAFVLGYNQIDTASVGVINYLSPSFLKVTQADLSTVWSPAPTLDLSLDLVWTRIETGPCTAAGATWGNGITCAVTADIFTAWTRWRRNF